MLRDAPGTGLSCTTAPGCAASARLTAGTLTGRGVAIPTLPKGGGVVVTLVCLVTATGR